MVEVSAPQSVPPDEGKAFLRVFGEGALGSRMGIKITEMDRERAVAVMPVEGNTQTRQVLHGGAYAVLGESLGSTHANFLAPPGYFAVGIDINATHTGAASTGYVTGVCTPIKVGRSIAVHEIIITDDRGHRCSTVRITNLYRQSQQ